MDLDGSQSDAPVLDSTTGFVRGLRRVDGVALVVGTVIGSGIFLVPGPIAGQLPSLGAVLLVWAVGGALSLSGALSLGELGAMYPGAGGLYVYLRHAFGRPLAFLYGWGLLSMIQTGSIATLAVGFSLYLSRLVSLSRAEQKATGIVAVLWAYEGWHAVSFAAGEFRSPVRDLPVSLFMGTGFCAVIYLLLNLAYYSVLTSLALRDTDHAAATAIQTVYGGRTTVLISALILTSILGAMNGLVLTGPRVYYAMGRDGTFFRRFGETSARFHTPIAAIVTQGLWASFLTLLGSFQQLFTYVIFTAWIFYGLTVAAVLVLRWRQPDLPRSFRVPGFPWPPLFFILAALGITFSTCITEPVHAALGLGMILAGIPLYLVFRALDKPANAMEPETAG